jgi:hypothetical protein
MGKRGASTIVRVMRYFSDRHFHTAIARAVITMVTEHAGIANSIIHPHALASELLGAHTKKIGRAHV